MNWLRGCWIDLLLAMTTETTRNALNRLRLPFASTSLRSTRLRAARFGVQAASRHRLDDLFQSLLHRAFNGEL